MSELEDRVQQLEREIRRINRRRNRNKPENQYKQKMKMISDYQNATSEFWSLYFWFISAAILVAIVFGMLYPPVLLWLVFFWFVHCCFYYGLEF